MGPEGQRKNRSFPQRQRLAKKGKFSHYVSMLRLGLSNVAFKGHLDIWSYILMHCVQLSSELLNRTLFVFSYKSPKTTSLEELLLPNYFIRFYYHILLLN